MTIRQKGGWGDLFCIVLSSLCFCPSNCLSVFLLETMSMSMSMRCFVCVLLFAFGFVSCCVLLLRVQPCCCLCLACLVVLCHYIGGVGVGFYLPYKTSA